jgi:hypothetical protein
VTGVRTGARTDYVGRLCARSGGGGGGVRGTNQHLRCTAAPRDVKRARRAVRTHLNEPHERQHADAVDAHVRVPVGLAGGHGRERDGRGRPVAGVVAAREQVNVDAALRVPPAALGTDKPRAVAARFERVNDGPAAQVFLVDDDVNALRGPPVAPRVASDGARHAVRQAALLEPVGDGAQRLLDASGQPAKRGAPSRAHGASRGGAHHAGDQHVQRAATAAVVGGTSAPRATAAGGGRVLSLASARALLCAGQGPGPSQAR